MKRKLFLSALLLSALCTFAQQASVRLDASVKHQRITGFGGFVCSPQFTYNHMSTADIKKVWGSSSTVGCNIMRLYIPIGRNAWGQSLQTAKNAKQMGLIVFASPWGQPAEWKTNNSSNAKNENGQTGSLKRENWGDYAQYLEDYVQYLRQNGVELDAISIQNEPDWPASYAGCLWSASEIAEFVRLYGRTISCKIMAPETLAVSDSYANALNATNVVDSFDIYGGHQYGGIQSAYKKLAAKGKQIWMTEYLINWNEIENNTRNFDFSKDFFNFFTAINTCMLGDFNAWIHYAAKRYYAMLGDGQRGTSSGVVTKRGYIMAHFARLVTGMTRIDADFGNTSLEGSAYLSETGDTVVAVMANQSDETLQLTLDLPFYTTTGVLYTTTKTKNFLKTSQDQDEETCRPVVSIAAQSVCTVLFVRSRDRQVSDMKGMVTRFDRLDDMKATKTNFGTAYQLSGKTKTFDHSNPLLSTRTTASYGYVQLDNRYDQLVMQVKKVSSTLNYTSALTTLYYVNGQGKVSTHDYGELDLNRRENFSLIFDLSPATLTDGCRGLISITNNNWSSTLTITFGDVYLSNGGLYAGQLSGAYVADDSYVLDYTSDRACTSLDFTAVTDLPSALPWQESTNRVVYVAEDSQVSGTNVVVGTACDQLVLSEEGGNFRPQREFTAQQASLSVTVDGFRLVMLPFAADIPEGASVYAVNDDLSLVPVQSVPAHTPVLVKAKGTVCFTGSGTVSYANSVLTAMLRGTYTYLPLYVGDYTLTQVEGQWGLARLSANATLAPFDVYAQSAAGVDFLPLDLTTTGISSMPVADVEDSATVYNLMGQRVDPSHRGIVIRHGKKYLKR